MTMDASHYKTLYHIVGMQPSLDMGGFGFSIKLYPAMLDAVAQSGLSQHNIDSWIETMGPNLLKSHGYDGKYARHYLRVTWGKWGTEHITVPGNACGLDIDDGCWKPPGGRVLHPHNVDCVRQSHLLLCIFTGLMDGLVSNQEAAAIGMEIMTFNQAEANESVK